MNRMRYGCLTAGLLAMAALCHAASVAGLVDSTEPFLIQGKVVSGPGITGWPVFVDERVTTKVTSKLGRGSDLALDAVQAGVNHVVPQAASLGSLDSLSPTDLSYFATLQPRSQANSAPIAMTFTSLPTGVTASPGPPPVSAYR